MDSDVIFVVASLCDCLKVCHHKTSNIIKLAIYQIINRNCQKYKQGIMPQSQLSTKLNIKLSIYKSGANHEEMEYVLFTQIKILNLQASPLNRH
jgi:hypothetical protein